MAQLNGMMNEEYRQAMAQQQHLMMQQAWERGQEVAKLEELKMHEDFERLKVEEEAKHWANELAMQETFT